MYLRKERIIMPNIKSSKKSVKTDRVQTANKELKNVIANIDKACSKGLVKKNTCARQKSRLNKKVKEMNN